MWVYTAGAVLRICSRHYRISAYVCACMQMQILPIRKYSFLYCNTNNNCSEMEFLYRLSVYSSGCNIIGLEHLYATTDIIDEFSDKLFECMITFVFNFYKDSCFYY